MSECLEWRKDVDVCVQEALSFYGTYLAGQTNGFSDALSLQAVRAAFEIEQVPADEQPEIAARLLRIHSRLTEIYQARAKMKGSHG